MDIASFDETVTLREQSVIRRPAKQSNDAFVVLVDERCDWAIPDDIDAPSEK
jgi:hypothetical protein